MADEKELAPLLIRMKEQTKSGVQIYHPETEAKAVIYIDSTGVLTAKNAQEAIDTLVSKNDELVEALKKTPTTLQVTSWIGAAKQEAITEAKKAEYIKSVDENQMSVDETGKLEIEQISTDIIEQGQKQVILYGGNAQKEEGDEEE